MTGRCRTKAPGEGSGSQRRVSLQIRGALNAVRILVEDAEKAGRERPRAVVTHSSGNHGQALARAARDEGNAWGKRSTRRA